MQLQGQAFLELSVLKLASTLFGTGTGLLTVRDPGTKSRRESIKHNI